MSSPIRIKMFGFFAAMSSLAVVSGEVVACAVRRQGLEAGLRQSFTARGATRSHLPSSHGNLKGDAMASKIEDYGLIGNTYTSALVSRSGSIDWLCAPRFDSDACFSALIGYDEHGRWGLRPTVTVRETRQRYRDDTMILETEFVCDGGVVRIIDFMPMGDRCEIVRIVEGVEGEVPLEMLLDVRFGYGADAPLVERRDEGTCFLAGP